jgi:hypothetical protein
MGASGRELVGFSQGQGVMHDDRAKSSCCSGVFWDIDANSFLLLLVDAHLVLSLLGRPGSVSARNTAEPYVFDANISILVERIRWQEELVPFFESELLIHDIELEFALQDDN